MDAAGGDLVWRDTSGSAAVSIPANMAGGCCRRTLGASLGHVRIALRSSGERETQVERARRLRFIRDSAADDLAAGGVDVGRLLTGLTAALGFAQEPYAGHQTTP
ncbi:MAG: four helix bundle protein [Acidobacteriota bacterium]